MWSLTETLSRLDPVEAHLRRTFPSGTVTRDGLVVGVWSGYRSAMSGSPVWFGVTRTEGGQLDCFLADDLAAAGRLRPRTVRSDPGALADTLRNLLSVHRDPERFRGIVASWLLRGWGRLGGGIRRRFVDRVVARHVAHVDAFLSTLDPVGLDLLLAEPALFRTLPYDMVDATVTPGAPIRAVLTRHPMLLDEFQADLTAGVSVPSVTDGEDAWDAAAARILTGRHGVVPWAAGHARAVQGILAGRSTGNGDGLAFLDMAADGLAKSRATDLARHLGVLGDLPRDWTPRDAENWTAYGRVMHVVRAARDVSGPEGLSAFLATKGRWAEWRAALARTTGRERFLTNAVLDVADVSRAFAAQVLLPALRLEGRDDATHLVGTLTGQSEGGVGLASGLARSMVDLLAELPDTGPQGTGFARDTASSLMFSGMALRSVLEVSAAWHARRTVLAAAVAAAAPGTPSVLAWSKGLPDHDADDVSVRVLTDDASLAAEGAHGEADDGHAGLSHCVGGYGDRCRSGALRVVSVRALRPDGGWDRLSTAAYDVSERSHAHPVLVQHRGHRNGPPPDVAARAIARYEAMIRNGDLTVDREGLRPVRAGPYAAAGYDWTVPGAWEAVRDAWAPFLPRRLRGLTRADWSRLFDAATVAPGGPSWQPRHVLDLWPDLLGNDRAA